MYTCENEDGDVDCLFFGFQVNNYEAGEEDNRNQS